MDPSKWCLSQVTTSYVDLLSLSHLCNDNITHVYVGHYKTPRKPSPMDQMGSKWPQEVRLAAPPSGNLWKHLHRRLEHLNHDVILPFDDGQWWKLQHTTTQEVMLRFSFWLQIRIPDDELRLENMYNHSWPQPPSKVTSHSWLCQVGLWMNPGPYYIVSNSDARNHLDFSFQRIFCCTSYITLFSAKVGPIFAIYSILTS